MSRSTLKIIACISMFIDHLGFVMFPHIPIFHLIGRIAMPIFAFFIAEGAIHTRSRTKYFLRVFTLGLLCQAVYIAEALVTHSSGGGYLNILITFSLSILLCSTFLSARENKTIKSISLFILCIAFVLLLDLFFRKSTSILGVSIETDYGLYGIFLPLFAVIPKSKTGRLLLFSLYQFVFAYIFYSDIRVYLCSLIPLVLLLFYNGKSGKFNLKYFFYAFYPCHLALIYLLDFIINVL